MFSSKLYSHPGKSLSEHLHHVAQECVRKFREIRHELHVFLPQEIVEKLIWLMGFSHDLGKATAYFQHYLLETCEAKKKELKNKPETGHSLISAVLTHWIAKESFSYCEKGLFGSMPFFLYLAVKKHHGNINNAIPSGQSDESNEVDVPIEHIDKQLASIEKTELQFLLDEINKKLETKLSIDKIPVNLSDYFTKEIRRKSKQEFKKLEKQTQYYFIFQYFYSLLLHSDKEDAIFSQSSLARVSLKNDLVERFKEKNFGIPKTPMAKMREEIYQDAIKTISLEIAKGLPQKIFSLNVPTGCGKTLTAFSLALKLRDFLSGKGMPPRIIYGLPFTSIIDQNYDVLEKLIPEPQSNVLLKHHHLAEMSYTAQGQEAEWESSEARFMIESWQSEVIVTTFFQIFHTLFTNRNRMIQKFHIFPNSIILLDEVQSCPYRYWPLLKETIKKISDLFHIYFILMTATQPKIFSPEEMVELVPNKSQYFEKLDRINLTFEEKPISLQKFIEKAQDAVSRNSSSFMFVMNTIRSALNLLEGLENIVFPKEQLYFLSTNIIPKHRLERVKKIKESSCRKIIVSTQLIEAGVDIDIENVWRDFAPLESINQVCGRCNRNFGEQKGDVKIYEILDEKNKDIPFSRYVYGKALLGLIETQNCLGKGSQISEKEFLKNIETYYTFIQKKMSADCSQKNLGFLQNFEFADLYKNFQLIEDRNYYRKDIFIELDQESQEIWQQFLSFKKIKDFQKRNEAFLHIKKNFYEYVISIPSQYVKEPEWDETGIIYIPLEAINSCYDLEKGWIRTNNNYADYSL